MHSFRLSVPFFLGTVLGMAGSLFLLIFVSRKDAVRPSYNGVTPGPVPAFGDGWSAPREPSVEKKLFDRLTLADDKSKKRRRKVFIDCGANTASSVDLFLDTYPKAGEFEIYSFEIDVSLRPYFATFSSPNLSPFIASSRHRLYCPVAVSDHAGNTTAYLQGSWTPKDRLQDGKEMHWGGGTLHPYNEEVLSNDGGQRKLSVKNDIPTIDLAEWILRSFSRHDFVILKMDIEGSEYRVLRSLLSRGALKLVDKLYGEMHEWAPLSGVSKADWHRLKSDLAEENLDMLRWEADSLYFADMASLSRPVIRPTIADGQPGELLATCRGVGNVKKSVGVSVAVGMNPLPAAKLLSTLEAVFLLDPRWSSSYDQSSRGGNRSRGRSRSRSRSRHRRSNSTDNIASSDRRRGGVSDHRDNGDDEDEKANDRVVFPVTVFLYSDFVKLFPDLVLKWSKVFAIGSRGQRPHRPAPYFAPASYRKSLIAATNAFREVNLDPYLLLSDAWIVSNELLNQARERGMSVVRPTVAFPPFYTDSPMHMEELYYQVRTVERTPKALRFINEELKAEGGVLTLDADQEDSLLISVFLLRFINEATNFDLIPLTRCF